MKLLLGILIQFCIAAALTPIPSGNSTTKLPFFSCGTESDLLNITTFSVDPFPIKAGKNVTVNVAGTLSEPLANGTTLQLQGVIGPFKFVDTTRDLCQLLAKFNASSCPIQAGSFNYTMTQRAPTNIPATSIEVLLKGNTPEGQQVACINGLIAIEQEDD